MCGVVAAMLDEPSLGSDRVVGALESIAHRGPDALDWWFSPDRRLALGHVRLSIIGLENGSQPLHNEAGDVHCVVNGELYGYRRIRDRLRGDGARFATDSDSEIALRLYEMLGGDFVHQLRGEFAVVVADQRRRCVIAVRDRFGIKPLFYAVRGRDVYLASEIKALIALGVPARWDGDAFFAEVHSTRTGDRTLFEGIFAVPPGAMLLARDGRVEIRRYWDTQFPTQDQLAADARTDADVAAGFRAVLDDAVRERMVADVEVASYLSGGIDSCAVLGLAQRHTSRPIRAFTIAFDDELYNEQRQAEQTARWLGAHFVPVTVSQPALAEAFDDAVWHAETLIINGHGIAKYLLSRAVRDAGIKVVFTGEGADEILGGYPPFRRDMLLGADADTDRAPEQTRKLLAELQATTASSRGLLSADGELGPGLDVVRTRLGWVPSALSTWSTLAAKMYPLLDAEYVRSSLLANPYTELLDAVDVHGRLHGRDRLNQALYLWTHTHLATYVLTFLADRMEMAHSVEGRVPFLDHHVAEYAANLPVHHKIRGLREKHVLREAVADCVLPEVRERHKHPFMAPPARDHTDPLALYCQDLLRSSVVEDQPFFDPVQVRSLMDRVAEMEPDARAAHEGVVLRVASACVLQRRFAPSA
ncbi:MAG TPA: asparagine synthase (glutamine-hydrolyzing) [Pseudonocardia sp.]|nr:asparagine synthase (glutamine-hydrolyzing) [Pseudonocardia sp.]